MFSILLYHNLILRRVKWWQVPSQSGVGHGAGMPVAMESTEAEGESAEEREAALNEAVSKRMQEIAQLVTWCSAKLGVKF